MSESTKAVYLSYAREGTEAAFAMLRLYAPGPMVESPNELRNDHLLARLQADPRFEEILKTAQPL
ncbi:MAG TPA: hypothetical protein VGD97_09780 [Lacunisphaera sp.]